MEKGNIVGEPFAKYVNDQIAQRQKIYGSGLDSLRDPKYTQYLNSRLSWIKMASSVIVIPNFEDSLNIENTIRFNETKEGIKKLRNLGLSESEIGDFVGVGLAKKAVLFNSLSDNNVGFKKVGEESDVTVTSDPASKYTLRKGVINYLPKNSVWNSNFAYGLGGLEFGIQPPPGIISFKVDSLNRGSIRKGTIQLKAYNKTQFEIINLLYLRLGFSMLIEWGNSHYISNKDEYSPTGFTYIEKNWFNDPDLDQFEILKKLEKIREDNDGNVDSFFCKVSNYSWSLNTDGSYDISIDLISLGDVIESLKVNTLTQPITLQNEEQASDKEWNVNDILNHLKSFENNHQIFTNYNPDTEKDKSTNVLLDLFIDENGKRFVTGRSRDKDIGEFLKIDPKYRFFYRLGNFLQFLSLYVIPKVKTIKGDDTIFRPLVEIDTEEEFNIMSIYPNQISFDPYTCIIKNTNVKSKAIYDDKVKKVSPYFYPHMNTFNSEKDDPYGKVMNIYLNFNFIKDILKNQDKKGNVNLYKLLTDICDGINKALGGVNNLEPVIVEERNTIILIDQNIVANNDKVRKKLNLNPSTQTDPESVLFNLYGYQGNESNFVKNYSLNTKITPDLATQISIGATATGTVVGEDSTFFSKLNSGLIDKFKVETVNNKIPDILYLAPKNTESEEWKKNYALFFKTAWKFIKNPFYSWDEETLEKANSDYLYYLDYTIGSWQSIPYLENNSQLRQQGLSLWKGYLDKLGLKQKEKNTALNTIGFIPLTLSLTLDGISGIKIFQKLRINTKFLPSGFPDDIDFIITKVNHNVSNNNWTTELEALSAPKTKPIIEEDTVEDDKVKVFKSADDLVFFPPITGNAQIMFTSNTSINGVRLPKYGDEPYISTTQTPLLIRQDAGGSGKLNASRDGGSRPHKGVDIKVGRGQPLYAPIEGKTTNITQPNGASGVKIIGSGKFKEYRAVILYTKNNIRSGTIVKRGNKIGEAVGKLYPTYYKDSKVGDHIHFSMYVEKNGQRYYLDPSRPDSIKYSDGNLFTGANSLDTPSSRITFIPESQVKLVKREFLNRQGNTITQ